MTKLNKQNFKFLIEALNEIEFQLLFNNVLETEYKNN